MNKVQPLDLLNLSDIETLVFAGGGNRCWWQAGIIVQLLNWGWNLPGQLIGTSAGAGIAVSCLADGPASALQACLKLYSCNPRVFDWQSLVKMKIRFAHRTVYPAWIEALINAGNFEAIRSSNVRLRIAITRPARLLGLTGSISAGTLAYVVDKYIRNSIHPWLPKALGLRQIFFDLRECLTVGDAQTILTAAAAVPPFMPPCYLQDFYGIDGGYTDNAPIPTQTLTEKTKTLVLLTRHYPHLPVIFTINGRMYWQPSKKVPVSTWDCTHRATVEDAFSLGVADAVAVCSRTLVYCR